MVTVHRCLLKTEKLLTEFSTTPDFSPPGILECFPQESRGPTVSQLPVPLAHLPFLLALHTGERTSHTHHLLPMPSLLLLCLLPQQQHPLFLRPCLHCESAVQFSSLPGSDLDSYGMPHPHCPSAQPPTKGQGALPTQTCA